MVIFDSYFGLPEGNNNNNNNKYQPINQPLFLMITPIIGW